MANLSKQQKKNKITLPLLENPKVALFGRVSSDKQAREATIERQRSVANELFNRYYQEKPRSKIGEFWDEAYNLEEKDENRGFWKMMKQVEQGVINTIIVSSEDRIFRGESAQLRGEITDILRHNDVRLITSNSDTQYSRSETTDRLVTSIKQEMGAINKLEAVKTLQHGRRRKLEEQNKWFLIICPYGLRCDRRVENHEKIYEYRIVEAEAEVVRDIFRLYVGEKTEYLSYKGVRKPLGSDRIAQVLNQLKVDRKSWVAEASQGIGTLGWDKQKVLRILRNETYTGRLTVVFPESTKVAGFQDIRTEKTIKIPAIVDDVLFRKANKVHSERRAKLIDNAQPRTERNYLHGLLECPICKSRMRGRVANEHNRYYGCPNTSKENPHPLLRADDYEGQVESWLVEQLDEANFSKLLDEVRSRSGGDRQRIDLESEKGSLENKFLDIRKKQMKLLAGWEDELIEDDIYRERSEALKNDKKEIETRVQAINDLLGDLKSPMDQVYDLERIRALLDQALKSEGDTKYKILRLVSVELLSKITLDAVGAVKVTDKMEKALVLKLLSEGRITAKNVRDAFGLQPKKFLSEFGRWPRKVPLSFKACPEPIWL